MSSSTHIIKIELTSISSFKVRVKMDSSSIINVLFLCFLNALFTVSGIILNSVVIISLWRSSQLRKQLCYFMILVLSCFDIAAVAIIHPLLIVSTIFWSMRIHREIGHARLFICFLLGCFSILALLMLNIERFLALSFPFFHQTAVTKRRITIFLVFGMIIQVALSPFLYFYRSILPDSIITMFISLVLCAFIYLNYKMLFIAKSKYIDKRIAPAGTATGSNKERKKTQDGFQKYFYMLVGSWLFFHLVFASSYIFHMVSHIKL